MNPLVIIAPIIGNMVSIFWFNMMDCGLGTGISGFHHRLSDDDTGV